jgi:ribonuclease HI
VNKSVKQTLFVNALIHNADRQVLLVRRSNKDHFLPGYLELPGGKVEQDETLEHGLHRKLKSELGVQVEAPVYYTSLAKVNKHGPYLRVVFEVAHQNQNIKLSNSHDEFVWVDKNVLGREKIAEDAEAILKQFLPNVVEETALPQQGSLLDDKKTTLIIYTDGGSRGNPGPSASGFVIYDEKMEILEDGGAYLGITTNNQAEYTAVVLALKAAAKHAGNDSQIDFRIDSLLVVNQMNGVYKIKNRDLWPIYQEIHELIKNFAKVTFTHVYRENNKAADAKVNEILDAHASK